MSSCLICCENFSIRTGARAEISCQWCQFTACSKCCKTYILDQNETVCMNGAKNPDGTPVCRKVWTRKFVTDSFPKSWVEGEWKKMNSTVMVEKEKALLPATMAVAENRKELQGLKKELDAVKSEIIPLQRRRKALTAVISSDDSVITTMNLENKKELQEEQDAVKSEIFQLQRRRWALKVQIASGGSVITTKTVSDGVSVGRKCPDPSCRGFLSSQWKCGLCEKWTCPDCHVIKGSCRNTEHTCDPDTLATVKLLDKDTKPCPSCSTPIHKIEGCDQMWCTQCHTAFSWRRGTIETRIHNPHFYEWKRKQNQGVAPRNPGDFECGRDLSDHRALYFIIQTLANDSLSENLTTDERAVLDKLKEDIPTVIRKTIHLQQHDGAHFITNNVVDNVELRVKYLLNEITESRFSSRVHAAYKAFEKKQDIGHVIQLQYQGVTDIIYRFADALKSMGKMDSQSLAKIHSIFSEVDELTKYSNEILREHSATYHCKNYVITYSGQWRVLI